MRLARFGGEYTSFLNNCRADKCQSRVTFWRLVGQVAFLQLGAPHLKTQCHDQHLVDSAPEMHPNLDDIYLERVRSGGLGKGRGLLLSISAAEELDCPAMCDSGGLSVTTDSYLPAFLCVINLFIIINHKAIIPTVSRT